MLTKTAGIWTSLLVSVALPPGPARADDVAVTIYADAGYPPYSYEKDGRAAGLYFNIVKAATARMHGYKVDIQPIPWKRGMALMRSGAAFALYPPYLNVKDEPWTWPYSLPLYDELVVAVCRKEIVAGKARKRWPADFYGLRVGNNAGFIVGGAEFDAAVQDGKITVEEGRDSATNLLKLGLGRIDCYINDRVAIQWTLKQLKREGKYDEGGGQAQLTEATVIAVEQGFLGFSDTDNAKYPFKSDFIKQFDTAIYQMKRNGEIDSIARAFFKSH